MESSSARVYPLAQIELPMGSRPESPAIDGNQGWNDRTTTNESNQRVGRSNADPL